MYRSRAAGRRAAKSQRSSIRCATAGDMRDSLRAGVPGGRGYWFRYRPATIPLPATAPATPSISATSGGKVRDRPRRFRDLPDWATRLVVMAQSPGNPQETTGNSSVGTVGIIPANLVLLFWLPCPLKIVVSPVRIWVSPFCELAADQRVSRFLAWVVWWSSWRAFAFVAQSWPNRRLLDHDWQPVKLLACLADESIEADAVSALRALLQLSPARRPSSSWSRHDRLGPSPT